MDTKRIRRLIADRLHDLADVVDGENPDGSGVRLHEPVVFEPPLPPWFVLDLADLGRAIDAMPDVPVWRIALATALRSSCRVVSR